MIFLGIDPGQTNLALVAMDEAGEVVDIAKPLNLPLSGVQRLSYLTVFIRKFIDHLPKEKGKVEMICLEGYANFETFGREMSGETGAMIKLALVGWFGLDKIVAYPTIVAPTKLKLFVIGKGSGKGTKKEDMKLWTYKRWGFEHADNNVVDAYVLAQVARALCADEVELHAAAERAIKELKRNTEWSPNWDWNELIQTKKTSPRSRSETVPSPPQSPPSSPTPSTRAAKPSSEPLAPTLSTRRLKRASSPVITPTAAGASTSISGRRLQRRRAP